MGFPATTWETLARGRAIALIAVSTLALGGCEPADQKTADLHVLTVPSVYPWQAAPFGSGRQFPALGKVLAAIKSGESLEIALDFPLHPGGFPCPHGVGGTIHINRGWVRFSTEEGYITLLPEKQVLCKPMMDSGELAFHYASDSEYHIGICAGVLSAVGCLDEQGENAWDNSHIELPREDHDDFARVNFRVECSYDFEGSLGDWGVGQSE